jgi:hypothetical protein
MRAYELNQGKTLTIFDIDETLFRTTAKIKVIKDGEVIKSLSNQEYNTYSLQPGEEYDFGEFRSAEKFAKESEPIDPMLDRLKSILKNTSGTVIMLTARADFDDKKTFLDTFRKHGIDIDRIHVHRAGNLQGDEHPAQKKVYWIEKYLDTGIYGKAIMYDDSKTNLDYFRNVQTKYPGIQFKAYHVGHDGSATKYLS